MTVIVTPTLSHYPYHVVSLSLSPHHLAAYHLAAGEASFDEQILHAAKAIASATSALVVAASYAQREQISPVASHKGVSARPAPSCSPLLIFSPTSTHWCWAGRH